MARVQVTFHSGALPPVCAQTGEPADQLLQVRAVHTPRWTWLLPFAFWAFLIARRFTTEATTGLLPFSRAAVEDGRQPDPDVRYWRTQ